MKGGNSMDQKKIGRFLKELRKEKNITQEQLAEKIKVSGRTVSRWETGSNMPDLDVLILISEFYGVELREILDGERKDEQMNKELKEDVLKLPVLKPLLLFPFIHTVSPVLRVIAL